MHFYYIYDVLHIQGFHKIALILLLPIWAKGQTVPAPTIAVTSSLLCTGSQVSFSSVTTGTPLSYTWSILPANNRTITSVDINTPTLSCVFALPIAYTIGLSVTDVLGTGTAATMILISKTPVASFNASLLYAGYPNELVLTNYSSSSLKNYWQFSDVSKKDSSYSTVKVYQAGGSYSVTLVALGNKGCNDTAFYAFDISAASEITLPNVFTPNNDDINDVFKPITSGIKWLNAQVFNRYGVMLASWDKVNGFWDGRTTSGESCAQGAYYVLVEAEGFDGKYYKLKGQLTLIR